MLWFVFLYLVLAVIVDVVALFQMRLRGESIKIGAAVTLGGVIAAGAVINHLLKS